MAFKNNRTFQMGSLYGSMSFLSISASDLSDRMLADFLDMESSQIVTIHIQSVDQTAAIKTIKRTITELDRSKIEEQKKAVRSGYDMDIIPSDLATYNCGNGWSVGRQTANGLKNLCDIIPPSEAKPGDLIFFQGTYNTSGASHVGIYVGNGMMIHCGDPISYASIETNYWQQHFYCFGRIP